MSVVAYLWNTFVVFHAAVVPFAVLTALVEKDFRLLVSERGRVGAVVAWYLYNSKIALGCAGAVAGFFGVVFGIGYIVKTLLIFNP